MNTETIITIIYGTIMFICGFYAAWYIQYYKESKKIEFIEKTTSEDIEVVCSNATVEFNKRTGDIGWHNNNTKSYIIRKNKGE